MSDEARNVEILKHAYKRWSDTLGESVDDWMNICDDNIAFGSLAQGAPEGASYLGFIFARADDPTTAEAALREAHARLRFGIKPEIPVLQPGLAVLPTLR